MRRASYEWSAPTSAVAKEHRGWTASTGLPMSIGRGWGTNACVDQKGLAMAKNTICVWYDKDAEAAARFYAATFPDSAVHAVRRAPRDYPSGKAGDVLVVEVTDRKSGG